MSITLPGDESLEKKSVAGVQFSGTRGGTLDEADIPNDDFADHYLYDGDTKSDSSYPVVDASGDLRRGNVESAFSVGARGGVSEESLHQKLRQLNDEFDTPPIDFEESMKFEKHVEIAKADDQRQVAVGVVMVPNSVDSQGDYERPETIESLSEGFMEQLAAGESQSGVMHATFPSNNVLSHVENRVLTESEKIGDEEYPAGTWVVGKKVRDDSLWSLIENETLSGFSIGGQVHDARAHSVDELPDGVSIDDDLRAAADDGNVPIREITDATIHEVSLVDHPAVQRAQIQTAKGDGDLAKAADELTHSVESAMEYLVEERGHEPEPARELAEFLNREKLDDGDESWLTRAKKFFTGGSDQPVQDDAEDDEKAGRTLSGRNIESARAVHDVALDMLSRSDVGHGRQRFSDDSTVDFDVGSYGAKAQQSDELAEAASSTGSTDSVETMNEDELKSLIGEVVDEKMAEQDGESEEKADEEDEPSDLEEIKAQLADLQESIADDAEEEEKSEDDDLGEIKEMLGEIASAQGVSQQADQTSNGTEKTWGNSPFAAGGGR